jgi:NAD(P)-dependent dehydrogenase (short-subunit alcohol dehydrogenase family)
MREQIATERGATHTPSRVLFQVHCSPSSEGREYTFATNLLTHHVLTEALIHGGGFGSQKPLLINMTSGGGYNVAPNTGRLNVKDPKKYNGTLAYGFHKRAQMVLSRWWLFWTRKLRR